MALSGDKDITIRVVVDSSGAVKSFEQLGEKFETVKTEGAKTEGVFSNLGATLVSLNQGVELAGRAFEFVSNQIQRMSDLSDVEESFKRLTEKAGGTADIFQNELAEATKNTITNFDLQRQAIEGLRAGANPDELVALAKAAKNLSEEGEDTAAAMDQLSQAFETGRVKGLQNKLGIIDIAAAEDKLAKEIGITADKLSAEGKVLAARTALLEAVSKKNREMGDTTKDAGDQIQTISVVLQNAKDDFLKAAGENKAFNEALATMAETLRTVNFDGIITGLIRVAEVAGAATKGIADFVTNGLQKMAVANNTDNLKQFLGRITEINNVLAQRTPQATKVAIKAYNELVGVYNELGGLLQNEVNKSFNALGKNLKDAAQGSGLLEKETAKLAETVDKTGTTTKKTADEIARLTDSTKIQAAEAKATTEAQKKFEDALKQVNDEITKLTGIAPELNRQVLDGGHIMQQAGLSAAEFDAGLRIIAADALKAGANVEAVSAAIAQLNKEMAEAAKEQQAGSDATGQLYEDLAGAGARAIADYIENGSKDASETGKKVGAELGAIVGYYFFGEWGSIAGEVIGGWAGEWLGGIFEWTPSDGTIARERLIAFFDAIDIEAVIQDQVSGTFDDALMELGDTARIGFSEFGVGLGSLLEIADTKFGFVASTLSNTFLTLNDLQLAMYETGISAEQMGDAVTKAFLEGNISFLDAQTALNGIEKIFAVGIPDGVGLADQAFQNFINAGVKGGLQAVDALKDIGAEAQELGLGTLQEVQQFLIASGKFSAEQISQFFDQLAKNGVDTVEELANLGPELAIQIGSALQAENFDFAEVQANIDDLLDKVNQIPEKIESSVTFNVKSNIDSNTQDLLNSGVNLGVGDMNRSAGVAS